MSCTLCDLELNEFSYIYKNDKGEYILRLSAGWNEHWDDFDYAEIEIKYCPECGRKL